MKTTTQENARRRGEMQHAREILRASFAAVFGPASDTPHKVVVPAKKLSANPPRRTAARKARPVVSQPPQARKAGRATAGP